jgi:hypothetical protein
MLNMYGPYEDNQPYWEKKFSLQGIGEGRMIIGGYMNFTTSCREVRGESTKIDILDDLFTYLIKFVGLIDVEPISRRPTWRNNKSGLELGVSK